MIACLGLDLAKATFDASLHPDGDPPNLRDLRVSTFPRTAEGVAACLAWTSAWSGPETAVVMEATGRFSEETAAWILDQSPQRPVSIVNPGQMKAFARSLGLRNKTDRLDARMIARYGAERRPRPFVPPSPARALLRDALRERAQLVALRTAEHLRREDMAAPAAVLAIQEEVIGALDRARVRLETLIKETVAADPDLHEDVRRLMTIPGIGLVSAATLLAEAGDLRRFHRARELSAFLGLSPVIRQSGTSIHGRTRLCKQGNPRVRQVLYMAAVTAARGSSTLATTYRALLERGKAPRSALGVLMRKLAVLARALLLHGHDYRPDLA